MKKKLLFCFVMMLWGLSARAMDSVSVNLSFQDDNGLSSHDLLIGVHKDATNIIDTALGERMLPEFPPPNDLYAILFIIDSTDNMSRYQSYVDFREIANEDVFVRNYRFKLFNLITSYTMSWSKIGDYIDSAFIRDIANGALVNVDMKSKQSYWVENFGMDQFNVVVYYNKNAVSVNEKLSSNVKEVIEIYPNPVAEEMRFEVDAGFSDYTITNSLGCGLLKGKVTAEVCRIDLSGYPAGMYFLSVVNEQGEVYNKKFIKY
jgi:hypothetical protein